MPLFLCSRSLRMKSFFKMESLLLKEMLMERVPFFKDLLPLITDI